VTFSFHHAARLTRIRQPASIETRRDLAMARPISEKNDYKRIATMLLQFHLLFMPSMAIGESPPDIQIIARRLEKNNQIFFAQPGFKIEYARVKSANVTPSLYSGGYRPIAFIVARSGDAWFTSEQEFTDRKSFTTIDSVSSLAKFPVGLNVEILRDKLLLDWTAKDKSAVVSKPGEMVTNLFHKFDYFHHSGLNAYSSLIVDAGEQVKSLKERRVALDYLDLPLLPDFVSSNTASYVVKSSKEDVDNVSCWVVEWLGVDKLWVDASKNFVVKKRVFTWGSGRPRRLEILSKDFREVIPEVWIPFKQEVTKFANAPSEDKKIWDKVTAKLEYEVFDFAVGNFDNLMRPAIPANTAIFDSDREMIYSVPADGSDPLSQPIAEGIYRSLKGWPFRMLGSLLLITIAIILYRFSKVKNK
jgi:hypothetical protein